MRLPGYALLGMVILGTVFLLFVNKPARHLPPAVEKVARHELTAAAVPEPVTKRVLAGQDPSPIAPLNAEQKAAVKKTVAIVTQTRATAGTQSVSAPVVFFCGLLGVGGLFVALYRFLHHGVT